jgi:hypothetical protein
MFAAQGFEINRSTLTGWVGQGCALIRPVADRIRDIGRQVRKLHVNDTPLPMLDPGAGKTKTARLWCYAVAMTALMGAVRIPWSGSGSPQIAIPSVGKP